MSRLAIAVLLLALSLGALGNDVQVSPDGTDSATCGGTGDPCATLGQALTLVEDEGTVTLQNGTYTGAGNVGIAVAVVGVNILSTEGAVLDLSSVAAGGACFYCSADLGFTGITFSGLVGDASAVVEYNGTVSTQGPLDVVYFDSCEFTGFSGSFQVVSMPTGQPCSTYWDDVTFTNVVGDWAIVECDATAVEGMCIARADSISLDFCSSTLSLVSISCNDTYVTTQTFGTLTASSSTFATILDIGQDCEVDISGADISECFFSAPVIDSQSALVDVFSSEVSGSQALNGTGAVPFLRIAAQTKGGVAGATTMSNVTMSGNFGMSLVHVELACSESGFCQELDTSFTLSHTVLFSNNFPAKQEGEPPFAMVHIANMTHIYVNDFQGKENHQTDNDGIVVRIETYSNSNVTIDLANMQFSNNTVVPMGLQLAAFGEVAVQMTSLSFESNNNRQATFGLLAEDFVIVEASMQKVDFTNNKVAAADDDEDVVLDAGVLYCANGKSQAAITLDLVSDVNFDGNNATAIVNEDCVIQCGDTLTGLCENAENVDSNPGIDVTIFVLVVVTIGMVLTIAVIAVVVFIREKHMKKSQYAEIGEYGGDAVLVDEDEEGTVVY